MTGSTELLDTDCYVQRVMAVRMARGWTLKQLSEASGVPGINLRRLNSGARHRLTLAEAMALAAALDLDFRDAISARPIVLEL